MKTKTPLSDISTEPDFKKLSYEQVVNEDLDVGTVQWTALVPEDRWDDKNGNDEKVGTNRSDVITETAERLINHPLGESLKLKDLAEPRRKRKTLLI